jgi:mannose-6-phosphate isomerase-like protein (cupin superfamily)
MALSPAEPEVGAKREVEIATFAYDKPVVVGDKKTRVPLAKTDLALFEVQVFDAGGENHLHAHLHTDGFWFVKSGRARFYTTGDVVIADLGPNQGVVIPRGYKYWFESVPSEAGENLELMHFAAADSPSLPVDHTSYERLTGAYVRTAGTVAPS